MKLSTVTLLALNALQIFVNSQTIDPVAQAQKNLDAAAQKYADARATRAQLVAALLAAQAEVAKKNQDLEKAQADLLQAQSVARGQQLEAEQAAISTVTDLIRAQQATKPPVLPKKLDPPRKSIFDSKLAPMTPKDVAQTSDPVGDLAAALAASGSVKTAPNFPEEMVGKPSAATVAWFEDGKGWNYVWLGKDPVAGFPPGKRDVKDMEFWINERWVKFKELREGPGRGGWTRRYLADAPVLSTKGNDMQIFQAGKWHWVPER